MKAFTLIELSLAVIVICILALVIFAIWREYNNPCVEYGEPYSITLFQPIYGVGPNGQMVVVSQMPYQQESRDCIRRTK